MKVIQIDMSTTIKMLRAGKHENDERHQVRGNDERRVRLRYIVEDISRAQLC